MQLIFIHFTKKINFTIKLLVLLILVQENKTCTINDKVNVSS